MAGYEDTKRMIIDTLMGRDPGTEIMPENHQAFALNMLDYIRSVEMSSASTLIGIAEEDTTPIQPDNARVAYIAGVAQERTVTFVNFHDINGQPISITTGEMEAVFVILLWNTAYWTYQVTNANIISAAENANFQYFLNIRKTYASVAAMNADADSHIADDGTPIRVGETVAVHNTSNPSENAIYSLRVTSNGVYYWQEQATLPALDVSGMFNQVNANVNYIECYQNAEDEIKIISDIYFSLSTHMRLLVKMTNTNTHPTPKLNINSTGAKSIWYNGAVATDVNTWDAGEILDIYYDGTNYQSHSIKDKTLYNLVESVNVGSQSSTTNAFNSVPTALRKLGLKVIYYDTVNTEWLTKQYIGSDLSSWNIESNWNSVDKFASGQTVNTVRIKDENGIDVTGDADVLSAEAGADIYDEVVYKDDETIDFSSYTSIGGYIYRTSNPNVWQTNANIRSYLIPVSDLQADKLVITANENNASSIAWMTSNSTSGTAAYVDGTGIEVLAAGSVTELVIPQTAQYLYVLSNNGSTSYLPEIKKFSKQTVKEKIAQIETSEKDFDAALVYCMNNVADLSSTDFQNMTSSYVSNTKRLILRKTKLVFASNKQVKVVVPYSFISGSNIDRVTVPLFDSSINVISALDFGWTYFIENTDFVFTIDLSESRYSNVRYVGIYFGSDVNITPSDLSGICKIYIKKSVVTEAVDVEMLYKNLAPYPKRVVIDNIGDTVNAGFKNSNRYHIIYQVPKKRLHIVLTNNITSNYRFAFKFIKSNDLNLPQNGPYYNDTGWINEGRADFVSDTHGCDFMCVTISKKDNGKFTEQNAIAELATMTILVEYANETTTPLFMPGVRKIAHRGTFHEGIPENSVPAFLLAKQLGYDYIECDVRVTSDGHYVIMHDESINRTCKTAIGYETINSTVNVADTTLADLRNDYVLACVNPAYRTPIPTLEEYLMACKGSKSIAMIEIEPMTNEQIQGVYDMCVDILGHGNFVFNSGGYGRLDFIRSIDNNVDLFYETSSIINTVSTVDGNSRNHPHNWWYAEYNGTYGTLNASAVRAYHALGMKVASWTVPSAVMESLVSIGVDAVATNDIPANIEGAVSVAEKYLYEHIDSVYTNGTISDNVITLVSDEFVKLPEHNTSKGIKCIRIKAKGNYTITTHTPTYANSTTMTTSSFTKTFNDDAVVVHELQLMYQSQIPYGSVVVTNQPSILIKAVGATEIYELEVYNVEVN